ncbi:hypothetical protein Aperf_G00000059310 [Anoplocephala perfoliata]
MRLTYKAAEISGKNIANVPGETNADRVTATDNASKGLLREPMASPLGESNFSGNGSCMNKTKLSYASKARLGVRSRVLKTKSILMTPVPDQVETFEPIIVEESAPSEFESPPKLEKEPLLPIAESVKKNNRKRRRKKARSCREDIPIGSKVETPKESASPSEEAEEVPQQIHCFKVEDNFFITFAPEIEMNVQQPDIFENDVNIELESAEVTQKEETQCSPPVWPRAKRAKKKKRKRKTCECNFEELKNEVDFKAAQESISQNLVQEPFETVEEENRGVEVKLTAVAKPRRISRRRRTVNNSIVQEENPETPSESRKTNSSAHILNSEINSLRGQMNTALTELREEIRRTQIVHQKYLSCLCTLLGLLLGLSLIVSITDFVKFF